MKVAWLTFHNAINYGAALQTYASQQALMSMGINCEIIDYVNEYRGNAYNMLSHAKKEFKDRKFISSAKYIAGGIFMGRRKQKFIKFYNNNIITTKKRFTCSKEIQEINDKFDKFIVGSDQVWNYRNNGGDFTFLLDFVSDNNKKISYSSSFGLSEIPSELVEKYRLNLKGIKKLSTRESYGVELIKNLAGREAELVLDPVFLLSKNQWLALCNNRAKKRKYVFAYTNKSGQWEDFLSKTRYTMDNMRIHKITRYLSIKDFLNPQVKNSYSISPIEFIETIANSELVVSASFHCIAMAIILNVQFVAILTGDKGKDERILNILRITGLEQRILHEGMTSQDVCEKIDYNKVQTKLSEYISKSYKFLEEAIYSK
ncbi:polysaccharide pyruvyl transferase family protein [Clostridium paraputrificum]|uniref:polysaccharide pyruvyl transferase family protein n=1 Tax=Clostridium paraputrificum TaxID=29363 RepID=UPI0018A05578|nr:polysaccharide pyruvyl transferase family protein [Clostridium paraputrificum]MDB2091684.1 polysaccharide pyruvyl transferase family protein [Clostridium paraputrificum]MDB2098649.1 polysaccharide pyruvyl transferase family protein [Clostridium paraputrificum]